jgi:Tol biopolymer transport system component
MASGQGEIYVAPVDGGPTARRWQISSGGGTEPHWAPDGKAIYYRSPTDHLMMVPVSLSAEGLTAGAPQQRFELRSMGDTIRNTFVLTPDGRSLILVRRADAHDTAVRVRTGWRPAGR